MSTTIGYSEARNNLASILDQVTDDCEIVTIKRRGHKDMALISASELSSMMETEYLLRSPKNAKRLMSTVKETEEGRGEVVTVDELRKEFSAEKPSRKNRS
jgi:antitoxin YefM